jgi:hypothetical protein
MSNVSSPFMSNSISSQLTAAMHERQLVRIVRRFESTAVRGYVVAIGPKFFLLLLVSDRIWFDGFECFRIKDVLSIQTDPYSRFVEAALKKRGQRRPRKPKINLESVEGILLSANKAFPLLAIHREGKDPEVCCIGKVCEVVDGKVLLLSINPHAKWEAAPDEYRVNQITRVNFGGDYEDALHIVGGLAAG